MGGPKKRIFITGGTGFIGRNLAEYLVPCAEVLVPTHRELELLDEQAVKNYIRKCRPEVVIHSAVKPGYRNAKDPTNLVYTNIRMFFNIVRCLPDFCRLIFLSSGAVYDERHYRPKMKEEYFDTYVPADDHGFSKYVTARYIERTDNITELRIFGVFGKYENYQIRFISNAICKAIFDLPITIKQNRVFSYLYIEDLCKIVEYFVNNESKDKIYNLVPDETIDLLSIAQKVKEISGKNLPIIVHTSGLGKEYTGNNSRLRNEIGNFTFTPLQESIKNLYNWYEKNKKIIDRDLLLVDP